MSLNITKNIFWLSFSRVISLLLLAIAYFALFRYLQPFKSGQYQFVLSYVLIFSTIVDFGIQQYFTKKISEDPGNTKKYFQNFFTFESFISVCLYALLVGLAWFRNFESSVFLAICVAGLGMVANALTYPFLSVMAAFQDMKKVALINFLNSLVNISVIFLAIYLKGSIIFLASIQLIFGILDLILYRIFVTKHIPKPDVFISIFKFEPKLILGILKQGWPFALLVGFSAIYNRVDVLIITELRGFTETGLYTAAYKIFDLLGFFPSVVSFTLYPFFAGLMVKKALNDIRLNLEKYLRLMIVLAIPMAVGGMLLSAKLIDLVAGPGFSDAAPVLAILIWAPAILFIYIPVNALVISQQTKKALMITGINVIVNILGNLILIPKYGIKVAAVMTVISESIQAIFYFYFVNKNIVNFKFASFFYKPFFSALIMAFALWYVRFESLIVSLPVGASVYLFMLVVTGFLQKSDIVEFKKLLKSQNS